MVLPTMVVTPALMPPPVLDVFSDTRLSMIVSGPTAVIPPPCPMFTEPPEGLLRFLETWEAMMVRDPALKIPPPHTHAVSRASPPTILMPSMVNRACAVMIRHGGASADRWMIVVSAPAPLMVRFPVLVRPLGMSAG